MFNENVPNLELKDLVQKYKTGKEILLSGSWIRNIRQSQNSAPHDNLFGDSQEHFYFYFLKNGTMVIHKSTLRRQAGWSQLLSLALTSCVTHKHIIRPLLLFVVCKMQIIILALPQAVVRITWVTPESSVIFGHYCTVLFISILSFLLFFAMIKEKLFGKCSYTTVE